MSAPGSLILQTGVDNSRVPAGLNQFEAMVNARVAAIQAKLGQLKIPGFGGALGGLQTTQLDAMEGRFKRLNAATTTFTNTVNRMSGVLSGGLGIGIAVGGLAALEKGFQRAIEKAKQFTTAQLAIAASIQSSYKIMGGNGQELTGLQGFQAAQVQAKKLNEQIIQRQAKNILTYQEELGAFQSSVNAGSRKGLSLNQILNVSENIAIAAKTLGLRGEQLANAARLALGGGVNVGRSTIGRALGITNEDIAKRSGGQLVDFLMTKTKGFSAGQPSFAKSIEGILSTLQARVDVFFARVGEKLFTKIAPSIERLGAALESGGADKFADMLVSLFNGVFNALQMIASSPAIPLIMKFLEFLSAYGDKIIIVAALGKFLGIIQALIGNVRLFTAGLGAMADKALFGAAAIEKEAVAAQSLNAATGGAAVPGGRSRGPLGAGVEGIASTAGTTIAARQALYREAVGRVGEFPGLYVGGATGAFAGRPGSGGVTNLPWYAPRYAQAETAHRKLIGQEMRKIEQEQLLARGRAASDSSFNRFTQNAAFIPAATSATDTEQRIAKAEASAKELRQAEAVERRAQFLDKAGLGGGIGNRLGSGALYASLAFLGTEVVKSRTDQSENNGTRFLGGALQTGGTAGAGLYGAGLLTGPVGLGAVAISALLGGLRSSLDQFDEAVKRSTGALTDFAAVHPQAAKIASLKELRNQMRSGTVGEGANNNSAWTNFWASLMHRESYGLLGDYSGGTQSPSLLTNRTRTGGAIDKKILEQQNIGRATFLNDTKQKDVESLIQNITKQIAAEELGFGNKSVIEERTLALNKAKIQDAAIKGELYIDPSTQRRAQVAFNQAERNRAIFRQVAPNAPLGDEMLKNNSLAQTEQDLKADQLTREAESKAANERRVRQLQQSGFIGGLNRSRPEAEFTKGLAEAESSIRQRRAEFEMPDKAFEKLVQTVKEKFINDFDLPTRKAEASIQALTLGGTPENLAKIVELTIQTTQSKIDKLADDLHLSEKQVEKLKVDAAHKIRTERTIELLNGGGLGVDEQLTKTLRTKRDEYRDLVSQQQYAQSERGIALAQRDLQDIAFQHADNRLGQQQSRLSQEHPLNSAEAQLGLESATINARKAQLAPVLDVGAPFSDAAAAIRYKIDSQKGFNAGQYEAAYRESKQLQEEEGEMAKQTTEIARQRAALNLARTEEDYKNALEDLTATLEERALETRKSALDRAQQDLTYTRGQEQGGQKISDVARALGAAGFPVPGGIPGVDVPLPSLPGGVNIPAGAAAPGSANAAGGLSITVPVSVAGITKEELERELTDELRKKVPPIIEDFVRDKKRKPH